MNKCKITCGLLVFSLAVNGYLFLQSSIADTKRELIDHWTSIRPGESIDSVVERMGDYSYHYTAKEGWDRTEPFFDQLPPYYVQPHEVYVFIIGGAHPYLFYVFTDEDKKVVYTWAERT